MKKKVLAILKEARSLLETMGWCQGRSAVDKYGDYCTPYRRDGMARHPNAVAFCAQGALSAVVGWRDFVGFAAKDALCKALPRDREDLPPSWWRVEEFNDADTTTKEDVLALYDRAIARVEAQS